MSLDGEKYLEWQCCNKIFIHVREFGPKHEVECNDRSPSHISINVGQIKCLNGSHCVLEGYVVVIIHLLESPLANDLS